MLSSVETKIKNFEPFFERNLVSDIYSLKEFENLLNLRPFMNRERFIPSTDEKLTWNDCNWLTDSNSMPAWAVKYYIDNDAYLLPENEILG